MSEKAAKRAKQIAIQPRSFYRRASWRVQSRLEQRTNVAWQSRLAELRSVTETWLKQQRSVWQEFPRQQPALDFAATRALPVALFSYEIAGGGQGSRRYLVADLDTFWSRYWRLAQRHFYELIPEQRPCHLYYDLEYSKGCNPDRNGSAMTTALIEATLHWLQQEYKVVVGQRHVLVLDSTTATKFSQHVIIRGEVWAFADNIHVGLLVQELLLRTAVAWEELEVQQATQAALLDDGCLPPPVDPPVPDVFQQLAAVLLVKNKHGQSVPFVDTGVYTKNRNFRLYLSCKRGKENPLVLAPQCEFSAETEDPNSQDLSKTGDSTAALDKDSEGYHHRLFQASLLTQVQHSMDGCRLLRCGSKASLDANPTSAPWISSVRASIPVPTAGATISGLARQQSPHPLVEAYVLRQLSQRGVEPNVRRWAWFEASKTLTIDIGGGYRYCERVQRHHKSNGIYIVVNLLEGLWYQKCHDPDCRAAAFRGADQLLPLEVMPFADQCDNDDIDDIDEAALADAMEAFESSHQEMA